MSNKIAYTQIDGWGVVGQIFDIVQIRPATFGSLDYSGTQSAMVVQITTKSGADLLSQAQLEDPDYFLRQIGSNFWIDADNGVDQIQGRFTLRAIRTISDIVVDLIFFYPDGVAPVFSLDLNNPHGTLTLEDFYRLSTDIPELDFYTETRESSYVDVGGGVRLPLPPMGSDTRSRWLPILSDFTTTIGQKVKLDGGIESSDGISISFIRDKKYEQTYKTLFQSFVTSTSEPRDERPFIYRDQKSPPPREREWIFTNEITPNRFKNPYDITEFIGTKNNTVPWDVITKDFLSIDFSSIDFISEITPSNTEIRRNPIAYYDNVIHTNFPLFSEAEPRDLVNDYTLRTRMIWVNSEAMQVKNIVVGGLLPTTRVSIRRGILNTEIKTHATQSEMYNSMPYPEGQRLRLFVDDLKLSYVKDREGFEYTGLIVEGKSDNNTASFSFNISTDVFSIYSSLNSGAKTQQAGTTSGEISLKRTSDLTETVIRNTQETNLSHSKKTGHVCTTSLYPSDEVYIRLAQRNEFGQDIDYDWISNDDNNNMVYERNKYFWGWVVWDDHYYRVVKDYKNFPVYKSSNRLNQRIDSVFNLPLLSLGNIREDFTVISHTPYFFNCIDPRKYEKTETSGVWFINKGLLTDLQKVDSINFGLTNLVVKKEYPADGEGLQRIFPAQGTFHPNDSKRIVYNFKADRISFQDPFAEMPNRSDPDGNRSTSPIDVSVIPNYKEKETTLGHVFETSSWRFLRTEIERYYEGIEWDIGTAGFYDQYCIVNIIDVILQLLTSTDTGTNSFKNLSSYSIANIAFENKFNFDILPAGLGLGIPTELIDLDSFLSYIFNSAKRTERVLLVRNLAITIDDAKDKTKLIENLLKSIYCTIVTDERGRLKLVDALSKPTPETIDVNDLANPDDQGTYSHSKITENITESILLQIDTYLPIASIILFEMISDYSNYLPYPKASRGQKINISSSTNLQDQNGESLFVNNGYLENLSSDIFSKIQSKPKETQVDLMKAGGRMSISRSSLLPFNDSFANIARTYIERYSRPVSTYEVNLKRSKQVELGGVYNIVLPNLPNLPGTEGGEVVGILIEQSVDIFNDIRSCVFYILQQNILRGEKDRAWTAAGGIEFVDNPTTFRILDNKYQTGFFDSTLPRATYQDKDIKGFLAGDFIAIYNKYFELKGARVVTQVDFSTNEIKIASATTPNIEAGDIIMISNITDQASLFEENAGRLFIYNNQQHKWK